MTSLLVLLVITEDLDVEEQHEHEGDGDGGEQLKPHDVEHDVRAVRPQLGVFHAGHDPVFVFGMLEQKLDCFVFSFSLCNFFLLADSDQTF